MQEAIAISYCSLKELGLDKYRQKANSWAAHNTFSALASYTPPLQIASITKKKTKIPFLNTSRHLCCCCIIIVAEKKEKRDKVVEEEERELDAKKK